MWQVVLFNVTNGLIIGAFYVLMALGLSLILNLSNVINFAHGNFLALGGYLAYTLSPTLGYWGALLVSPLLTALLGVLVERLMIRRIYNRDPVYSLLLTFGLAFVIQDASRYIWGPNGLPMGLPDMLAQPITPTLVLHHLVPRLHGDHRHRHRGRAVRLPALHPHRACASAPAPSISKPWRRSASMCAICAPSILPSAACSPA